MATGKQVAAAAAKHLTPTVLELGGKDPMIVLADANLQSAARAAIWGAFCNAGQACASVERCYVHESIATQFIELVVKETRALKLDRATENEVDVGAMSNEGQLATVEEHIADAVKRGADAVLAQAGLSLSDVQWVLPHQPNGSMLASIIRELGLDPDRVVTIVHEVGSVGAASIPTSLDRLLRAGRVRPGDRILMVGVGAGLSSGALLFQSAP